MMKKTLATILATVCALSLLAGCSGNGNNSSSSSTGSTSSSTSSSSTSSMPSNVALKDVHEAVKKAYGEDYLPSMEIPKEQLAEVYKLTTDNIEEVIAEGPMISTHVDQFIAIKAKEGKGADVEKELNAYRDTLVNDSMQYPMNQGKVKASEVFRNGDYVFFVMLGKIDEGENDESGALEFAKNEVKKGVDAIKDLFK